MVKKSKKSSTLDVRTPTEIPMLEKLLSKGPMAIVLIYADWCGHCTQFKEKVWNDSTLSKIKNVNNAAIHYDMLDQTSLKNTKVNGYPSMFLVGNDKEAKEIPTPQSTEELLKFDTKSANAITNTKNNSNSNINTNSNNNINSNININNSNNNFINNNNKNNKNNNSINSADNSYTPGPPDSLDDIDSQSDTRDKKQTGGSLYDVLNRFTNSSTKNRKSHSRKSKRKNRLQRALTQKRK